MIFCLRTPIMNGKSIRNQHMLLVTPLIPRTRPLHASRPRSCTGSVLFLCTIAGLVAGCTLGACCGYFLGHEHAKAGTARAPIYSALPIETAISIIEPLDAHVYHETVSEPALDSFVAPAHSHPMLQAAADQTTALQGNTAGATTDELKHAINLNVHPISPPLRMFLTPVGSGRYHGKYFSQIGQDDLVDELLGGAEDGFFVESGAYNGVDLSNTLFLEATRGWRGLLIEANPYLYEDIITKSNRTRSTVINACLSPTQHPTTLPFRVAGPLGGLTDSMSALHKQRIDHEIQQQRPWVKHDADGQYGMAGTELTVNCWPLHDMLQAIGQTRVDYWSLDTEGSEADILHATDFSKIDVRVITVEVNDAAAEQAVLQAMADKPYQLLIRLGSDLVFVKHGAFDASRLSQISAYNPSYTAGTAYNQQTLHSLAGQHQSGRGGAYSSAATGSAAVLQPIPLAVGSIEEDWPQEWFGPEVFEELWPGAVEGRWSSDGSFLG